MKIGLSRRDLLRLTGLGAAGMALGCGDNETARPPGAHHAAAVLEPESDSFLVAAWSSLAREVTVEVSAAGTLVATSVASLRDGHAAIAIDGLAPGTLHDVVLTTDDGIRLGPHRVQTAPRDDDPRPVRLAVSADLDPDPAYTSDLLAQLSAAAPELYVSLGDFPYTDNGPPAMTVEAYRARHAQLRTDPRVRAWLQTVGVRAIYDDHEFRNDWDASFVAAEPERYAAAMQVWDEFFPLRRSEGDIRYRRWRWGAHVECFLLDCRRFRSADAAPDDAQKTMLGEAQRRWLLDAVTSSPATFKLIFTSVPLAFGTGDDHWSSFATERDAIFDALRAAATPGILFLSGDQHFFAAHRHAYGLREIQVGPLARGVATPGPDAPGVLFRSPRYNFALLDIDGDQLSVSGVGADGEVFYREMLTADELTPAG